MIAPGTELVDGASDQFLSSTRFADDQDGAIGPRHLLNCLADRLHGLAFAGQQAQVAIALGLVAQESCLTLKAPQLRDARFQLGDARIALTAAITCRATHADMVYG